MSCASSSRRILQPLIQPGAVRPSCFEPLPFLCPRYILRTPSNQSSKSTRSRAHNTSIKKGNKHYSTLRNTQTVVGHSGQDNCSATNAALQGSSVDAKDGLSRKFVRNTGNDDNAPYNAVPLEDERSQCEKQAPINATSLIKSLLSKIDNECKATKNPQPPPSPTEPALDISREWKQTHQGAHTSEGRPLAFGKPLHYTYVVTKDIKKFVEQHLINKSSREWVNSELRDKHAWSFQWMEAIQVLLSALEKTEGSKDQAGEDLCPDEILFIKLVDKDYIGMPVPAIPLPLEWTKETFAQYVHDLCRSRMPRSMSKAVYQRDGQYHHETVREYLQDILFTKDNAALMSSQAFESALRFFSRYEYLSSVQRLFVYMQSIQFKYTDACFDIVLRNAAIHKDLLNFTALLKGALDLGFSPSGTTWASLCICMQSDRASGVVFDLMKHHDLIKDTAVRQDLAKDILDRELRVKAFNTLDTDTILADMDSRLGEGWFCLQTANVILKYLCMSSSESPIFDFLERMRDRDYVPDINSLNLILQRRVRSENIEVAIRDVSRFHKSYGVTPDVLSYEFLFKLAWKQQLPNVCRILWGAACIHRRVPWSMEAQVSNSFEKQTAATSSVDHRWESTAGLLIIGFDPRQFSKAWIFYINAGQEYTKPKTIPNLILSLAGDLNDIRHKQDKIRLARFLMTYDQDLYKKFIYPLGIVIRQLKAALKCDRSWKQTGVEKEPIDIQLSQMIRPILLEQQPGLVKTARSMRSES